MANIYASQDFTWAGVSKRFAKGEASLLKIAEVIDQDLSWINALALKPGNGTQGHEIAMRVKDAVVYKKQMNEGVPSSVSETVPAVEPYAQWESYTKLEEDIYNKSPEPQSLMVQEATSKIRAHKKALGLEIIYGAGTANSIRGFATRINAKSNSQFFDAKGATANSQTSIYMFSADPMDNYLFFSLNSKGGLSFENLGKQLLTEQVTKDFGDGLGSRTALVHNTYMVQKFRMEAGLANENFRQIVRIGNIDMTKLASTLTSTPDATSANIFNCITLAKAKLMNLDNIHALVSPTVYAYMEAQAYNNPRSMVTVKEYSTGYQYLTYAGVIVHRAEQVKENEAVVS